MPEYQTPGVYIEEIANGARPIGPVGTRTAGFVGVAPTADSLRNKAVAVNNWAEFVRLFGFPSPGEIRRTGKTQENTLANKKAVFTDLYHAIYGFFLNGGSRCYVVDVGPDRTIQAGLDALGNIDEVAIVAAPGYIGKDAYDAICSHCGNLKDRVGILDGPENMDDIDTMKQLLSEDLPTASVATAKWIKP
jgi:phage tail sheath protein FI